jgi:riboflavin kinase/FMN adenylyltransferase
MQVFRGVPERANGPVALTIGNFDGVHLGHQAMLTRLRVAARRLQVPACVMTFEPQPQEFFAPDRAPARLTNLREKLRLLESCSVDRTYVCRFGYDLARQDANAFIEDVLQRGVGAKWLLVGDDFRFGARRGGDFALLAARSTECGYQVESMPSFAVDGVRASSTAVRGALASGDLELAASLLGRNYSIEGRVVRGAARGAKMGFPTANVALHRLRPALAGIFVVEVEGIDATPVQGVASLGMNPTVTDQGRYTLEVFLFDFDRQIYGQRVRVLFLKKLRDEAKFASVDALIEQMDRDVKEARRHFENRGAAHRERRDGTGEI